MPQSYPVGQAPWEAQNKPTFAVGSAPWEQAKASVFGNPIQDIQDAGSQVNDAISGTGAFQGKNSLERGFSAASTAALAVPTVAADVIPGGKAALGAVSSIFDAGTNFFGNSSNMLADVAQKIGIMTPEQRKQYDQNNADFATSPTGVAIQSAASIGQSAGNIASVILMADGTAKATQDFIDNKLPAIKKAVTEQQPPEPPSPEVARQTQLVQKTANEIKVVEDKYQSTRNANNYSKDGGGASRERIAQSGVLKYTVDDNGIIRTKDPGGAVDQYRAMTVQPAEGVIRNALVKEGSMVNLSEVEQALTDKIQNSGLEGGDLVSALNGVKREIAGLRLKADAKGYVPTALLQDAKVNMYNNINYNTPPEVGTYRKAVANSYKTLIEDNSSFNVKEVNAELGKYYDDISRLEALDGKRVVGGRLGKYTAQLGGHVVGGAVGLVFGPFGGAAGAVLGGEAASLLKGKAMEGTFNKGAVDVTPSSDILDTAVKNTQSKASDVEARTLAKYEANPKGMLDEYHSKNGNVVSTDEARKLFSDVGYNGTNSAAVQKAAKKVSDAAFEDLLSKAKPGTNAFFMAGGSGAAKSTAVRAMQGEMNKAAFVFDGNLSNYDSAIKKISRTEDKGVHVTVPYVWRDPVSAWRNGVISRMLGKGEDAGRIVPLKEFLENTVGALSTVKRLISKGVPVKGFKTIEGGPPQDMTISELKQLSIPANLQSTLTRETRGLLDQGKITKEQYNALMEGMDTNH